MRPLRLASSAAILIAIGYLFYSESAKLNSQQREIDELNKRVALPSLVSLETQDKCARQALVAYEANEKERRKVGFKGQSSYSSHYNQKLNRCFVELESTDSIPMAAQSKTVMDAFELRAYATYYWANPLGKKYWEVKPTACVISALSGPDGNCESVEEFDRDIKEFMDR